MTSFVQRQLTHVFTCSILYLILFGNQYYKPSVDESKAGGNNKTRILIVLSVSPKTCPLEIGEEVIRASLLNKQRYAQLKGYDVVFNRRQPDPRLSRNYNKIAILSEILRNQSNVSRAYEWIMWVDMDTLVYDMSFDVPFERYKQVNMVVWGDKWRIRQLVDGHYGLNSGVFLLRNNDWSREFLRVVATFGHDNGKAREHEMRKRMYKYTPGITDQNAMVYVLKYYPKFINYVFFENYYGINRYWAKYLILLKWNPFIIHFAGCQFCSGPVSPECQTVWNVYLNESSESYSTQLGIIR